MTPQQEIIRAEDAKQLLNNPLFQESIKTVRDGLIQSMSKSALGDESTHHRLVIALQLLGQIEKSLTTVIETGEMAAITVREGLTDKIKRVI